MKDNCYHAYVYKYQMIKEKEIGFGTGVVNNVDIAARLIRKIIEEVGQTDRENMVVAMLNPKNMLVGVNLVSTGTLTTSYFDAKNILKVVLTTPCCDSIIIGHNHPSGDCKPSKVDKDSTQRLVEATYIVGVTLHDHIIVATQSEEFYSFSDAGALEQMRSRAKAILRETRT